MRVELDSGVRRSSNGTALFGGAPFRLIRLSDQGKQILDQWLLGGTLPAPATEAELGLAHRLIDAGILHPFPDPVARVGPQVGFVVPVYDDADGAAAAVASIRVQAPDSPIVVVDDASPVPVEVDRPEAGAPEARLRRVRMVRHATNRGPGAARSTGVAELSDELECVIFVDSDATLAPDGVATLLAHFADPTVTAVAPRVRAARGPRPIDRYEAKASPLDMGPRPAVVRPGSPTPYVPATVLAVRRSAFAAAGGFDETMRLGEDVDFIWRLVKAGGVVRYEPRAEAHHRNRSTWRALARQRYGYGKSAASLDERHPREVAPVELSAPMLAAWASAGLGGPIGAAVATTILGVEIRRFHDRLDLDLDDTLALSAKSIGHAGRWLANAVRRAWLPAFIVAALFSRRARRVLLASFLIPIIAEGERNPLARALDETSYCTGLWRGALQARSARALLPCLTSARRLQNEPA